MQREPLAFAELQYTGPAGAGLGAFAGTVDAQGRSPALRLLVLLVQLGGRDTLGSWYRTADPAMLQSLSSLREVG